MRERAGGEQRPRHISRSGAMSRVGEQLIDPGKSLGMMPPHIPEPKKRARQLHCARTVVCFQPVKRGAKVVLIRREIVGGAGKGLEISRHLPYRFSPDNPVGRKTVEDCIFLT